MNFFKENASYLIKNEYSVIPIPHASKSPSLQNWTKLKITDKTLSEWEDYYTDSGIGILCEKVVAIDIDIYDKEIVDKLIEYCIKEVGASPIRIGKAPKALIVYKNTTINRRLSSTKYTDIIGKINEIEILTKGKQFVAYGIHPDTKKEYIWGHKDLLNTPVSKLPEITPKQVENLFTYFDSIIPNEWETGKIKPLSTQYSCPMEGEVPTKVTINKKVNLYHEDWNKVLGYLDPNDYEMWRICGKGLYDEFDGNTIGFKLWYEWSLSSSKSSEVHDWYGKWQSFKWDTAKEGNAIKGVSLIYLAKSNGYKDVDTLNIKTIKTILPAPTLDEFLKRFVFIKNESLVFDLSRPSSHALFKLSDFRNTFSSIKIPVVNQKGIARMAPITNIWLENSDRITAEDLVYTPNKPVVLKDEQGYTWVNEFCMPDYGERPTIIDVGIFLTHLEYLFPYSEERKWFLQWIAHIVQYPEKRPKVTPFHVSIPHGTGRGWLCDLLTLLLGKWNCSTIDMDNLSGKKASSQFQEYMHNKLLCTIPEVKEGNRSYSISYKLRSLLTDSDQNVNVKSKGKRTMEIFTRFFLMSNYVNALIIDPLDRRINFLSGPSFTQPKGYYTRLYNWITKENLRQLYHFLLTDVDLSDFEFQRAFSTVGKVTAVSLSISKLEDIVADFLSEAPNAIMTFSQISREIEKRLINSPDIINQEKGLNPYHLRNVLSKHATCYKKIRLTNSITVRPWILKNLTDEELKLEIEQIKNTFPE